MAHLVERPARPDEVAAVIEIVSNSDVTVVTRRQRLLLDQSLVTAEDQIGPGSSPSRSALRLRRCRGSGRAGQCDMCRIVEHASGLARHSVRASIIRMSKTRS